MTQNIVRFHSKYTIFCAVFIFIVFFISFTDNEQDETEETEVLIENPDNEGLFEMLQLTNRKNVNWCERPFNGLDTRWTPPKCDEQLLEPLSPIEYFFRYVPRSLFETMSEMTNIYALQKGTTTFPPTNTKEIEQLVGLHIMMGALQFPRLNMNHMTKKNFFEVAKSSSFS